MKHRSLRTNGFTIVELLIVIVVIGILAVLSVVAYGGITGRATDNAVLSDMETLATLQTDYALDNATGGKSWYSPTGIDSELQFTPSGGNIIDVTSNQTDYCIRVYNPGSSQYRTLSFAAEKGSSPDACAALSPSLAAQTDSPPSFANLQWTEQSTLGNNQWLAAAISDDGSKVAVGEGANIRVTSNGGASWTTRSTPAAQVVSIASDSTGQKLVVGGSNVHTSTNAGASWTTRSIGCNTCQVVTSSNDGSVLLAADSYGTDSDGGYVYVSTDAGATWSQKTSLGLRPWYAAASSDDGSTLIVASELGTIYTSADSGDTWTLRTFTGSGRSWRGAAMSSDGQVIYLAPEGANIYRSTNGGVTWSAQTGSGSRNWLSIATSYDGSKVIAAAFSSGMYASLDSGVSWSPTSLTTGAWWAAASSSNGTRLVTVEAPGSVWTGVYQQ